MTYQEPFPSPQGYILLPFQPTTIFQQGDYVYYGIPNETAAAAARSAGYTVTHNPNDPSGAGLFVQVYNPYQSAPVEQAPIPNPSPTPTPTPTQSSAPPSSPTGPVGPVGPVGDGSSSSSSSSGSPPPQQTVPPEGPIAPPSPSGPSWDQTQEGAGLNDAYDYLRDVYSSRIPAAVQQIKDHDARLIVS